MLGTIILWGVVITMLVVMIPVGIAFYQRLRAREADRQAALAAAARLGSGGLTSRVPAMPDLPPQKSARSTPPTSPAIPAPVLPPPAPAAPAAPVAPAAPPAAKSPQPAPQKFEPPSDSTKMIDDPKPQAEPAGTEMLQWYGMLHCTSGPGEGERIIIEEEGFYIGRDAALSKVVVADNRVSKRHVRIIPKDGRVHAIDQNSTNGTFIGKSGQRITDVQLKRGDTITLADGAATFVYQI